MNICPEKIKEIRVGRGLTGRDFGEILGISKAYVSMLESGKKRSLDADKVNLLCEKFGCTVAWLTTPTDGTQRVQYVCDQSGVPRVGKGKFGIPGHPLVERQADGKIRYWFVNSYADEFLQTILEAAKGAMDWDLVASISDELARRHPKRKAP